MAYGDSNRAQMLARTATSPRARWGWGPSDLASKEERDAFRALRVGRAIEQGQATVAELPEAYGGRPQGTTRRAIRQQQAWEAEQAAILQQQQEARQIEEFQKNQRIKDLTIEEKEYDFRTKREDDLFNSNESVKTKAAEAGLAEFANTLDPTNPTSASRLAAYIQNNPYLLNSPRAAKRYDYFTKAAANSVTVIEGQQNKAVEDAVSAALRAGLTEAQIAEFETLDQQGRETFDIGGLRRATDIVIGGRAAAAEERKEPTDTRTEVEKARDRLAEAQAALGALSAEDEYGNPIIERDSPEYIRAFKDVEVARTRVERLEGVKTKPREEPRKKPREEPKTTEGPTTPSVETTPEPAIDLPKGKDVIQVALDGVGGATLDSRGLGLSDRAINVRNTLLNNPTSQEAVSAIRMSGLKTADDLIAAINYAESVNIENSKKTPPEITSKEEFERIPSGMMFISPDGTRRRKQ